jgi:hypothetical protein
LGCGCSSSSHQSTNIWFWLMKNFALVFFLRSVQGENMKPILTFVIKYCYKLPLVVLNNALDFTNSFFSCTKIIKIQLPTSSCTRKLLYFVLIFMSIK